ncbi:hypothetical protein ACTFIY_003848 [Dictyostelium cf. discoideum]
MRIGTTTIRILAVIESIRCTNNLVDMDHHNKKPTFTRHIVENNNNSTRTIERRLDRIYISKNIINYRNLTIRNIIPPKINNIPISEHNFLSTSKIDNLLTKYNEVLTRNYNGIKFSQLISLLTKVNELYTNFQKQNDYNTKTNLKILVSLLDTEYKDQAFATISAINESKKRDESLKQELDNYCEDTSLRYISAILKKRNSDFIIKAVKNQHGESISDQKGIEKEYLNFYTNLYNAKIDDPMIHQELLSNWPVQRDEKLNKLDEDFLQQKF